MKNIDWKNLGFGYVKTDYNVRCYFRNGEWGKLEISSDEYIPMHMAASCLHYGQEAFEGMKQEDFERLKKYNESYEDGRNLLHYFIQNIGTYEGTAYYQEKAKQPTVSFKKFSNEVKNASRAYIELNAPKRAVMFLTKNTWKSYALGLGCVLDVEPLANLYFSAVASQ